MEDEEYIEEEEFDMDDYELMDLLDEIGEVEEPDNKTIADVLEKTIEFCMEVGKQVCYLRAENKQLRQRLTKISKLGRVIEEANQNIEKKEKKSEKNGELQYI